MSAAASDFWQGHFAPAAQHDAGAGSAMYRKCLSCGGQAMEGALSAHARWCDKQKAHKALTLAAFDNLHRDDRRQAVDRRNEIRAAAKAAA